MSSSLHSLELDVDSFGQVMGPAGLDDLLQDIHHGFHARAVLAPLTQQVAGALARRQVAAGGGTGKHFAVQEVFDALDFHYWWQTEGMECWQDDQFIHEKRRDVPDCVVGTGKGASNKIIVPETRWSPARSAGSGAGQH